MKMKLGLVQIIYRVLDVGVFYTYPVDQSMIYYLSGVNTCFGLSQGVQPEKVHSGSFTVPFKAGFSVATESEL